MGGMGEIYLAKLEREAGFEKELVIKRILPTLSDDPEFIEMFNREACVAARLNHQNVVQIFDYGQHHGAYFIAMEYVHGRDLRTVLEACAAKDVHVPSDVAYAVASAVAEGLHYAHRRRDVDGTLLGLVHRDVSPQNILISYEGEIKLTDFGLVQTGDVSGQERDGVLRGKFAYMSPEQTWGDELDVRSDVFSLGIVTYELFCGHPPFEGETLSDIMARIRADPLVYEPASVRRAELPVELDALFARALAPRREDRFADVRELQHALDAVARIAGWTRSPLTVGSFVAALCPPGPTEVVKSGGGTHVSDKPIALRATEPAAALVPAARPLHHQSTVPASVPIVSREPTAAAPGVEPAPHVDPIEGASPAPVAAPAAERDVDAVPVVVPDPPLAASSRPAAEREGGSGRWIAGAVVLLVASGLTAGALLLRPEEPAAAWTLHIDAVPENTEVFVDGASQGTAPTSITNLQGGRKVEITLAHDGYKTQVETVDLQAGGGTQRVRAVLEPAEAQGHIMLTVDPTTAAVFVGDVPLEANLDGPGTFRISGTPGAAVVRVEAEGYLPSVQSLEIPARSVTHHVVELRPRHVRVDVAPEREGVEGKVTLEARDFQTSCGLPCSVRVPWARQGRLKVTAVLDGVDQPWSSSQPMTPGGHLSFVVPVPEAPRAVDAKFRAVLSGRAADGTAVQHRLADAILARSPSGVRRAAIPDGPEVTLRYEYEASTRKLRLNLGCDPWCQVVMDGKPLAQTPLTGIVVGPGNHTLQLTNRDAVIRLSYTPDR